MKFVAIAYRRYGSKHSGRLLSGMEGSVRGATVHFLAYGNLSDHSARAMSHTYASNGGRWEAIRCLNCGVELPGAGWQVKPLVGVERIELRGGSAVDYPAMNVRPMNLPGAAVVLVQRPTKYSPRATPNMRPAMLSTGKWTPATTRLVAIRAA